MVPVAPRQITPATPMPRPINRKDGGFDEVGVVRRIQLLVEVGLKRVELLKTFELSLVLEEEFGRLDVLVLEEELGRLDVLVLEEELGRLDVLVLEEELGRLDVLVLMLEVLVLEVVEEVDRQNTSII